MNDYLHPKRTPLGAFTTLPFLVTSDKVCPSSSHHFFHLLAVNHPDAGTLRYKEGLDTSQGRAKVEELTQVCTQFDILTGSVALNERWSVGCGCHWLYLSLPRPMCSDEGTANDFLSICHSQGRRPCHTLHPLRVLTPTARPSAER